MKEYDLIVIGTGSAMNIVDILIQKNPNIKIAVIDKDEPGGICLTRGCIPSKILLYPAELVRIIEKTKEFGIEVDIKKIQFKFIMERMKSLINRDINIIRQALKESKNIDYYKKIAQFIDIHTLKVGEEIIHAKTIILCTGSKPLIPPIEGLDKINYLTSDTVLSIEHLPKSIAIVGGGYIAAEYGHFFSSMGSEVTIIGRNPQFLPEEEPEVSNLAKRELQKHLNIITNHEVKKVEKLPIGKIKITALNKIEFKEINFEADEVMIATGRSSNSDILHPEKSGIKIDQKGWIIVNEYLETSQPDSWALGDAIGHYQFKHVANYESMIVYYNAILKRNVSVDYHAIPHAVFTHPEISSVGLKEDEAIKKYGKNNILIGIQRYQDTAKGEAMGLKDFFVKVIIEKNNKKIIGAHIIGPYASVLIQEIINLMYTKEQTIEPIFSGMHIHPALSEVVEKAFGSLMSLEQYHHILEHHFQL